MHSISWGSKPDKTYTSLGQTATGPFLLKAHFSCGHVAVDSIGGTLCPGQ